MTPHRTLSLALAAVCALGLAPWARAFDHADGPAVVADRSTDLTGLYAWTSGGKLMVVVNTSPSATVMSRFSTTAAYTVHVTRAAAYGDAGQDTTIVCTFDAAQAVTCWPGNSLAETTSGDATNTAGLSSTSGKFKVFTGLRADPEALNLAGLKNMISTVNTAAAGLTFDGGGCPSLDANTSAILVDALRTDEGMPATNVFAGTNVLSIAMEVDLSLLTGSGNILGVWASTNKL